MSLTEAALDDGQRVVVACEARLHRPDGEDEQEGDRDDCEDAVV